MPSDWSACLPGLLSGLAHAANNRIGALVALTESLDPGAPPDAEVLAAVRGEATRLEALLGPLRSIAEEDDAVETVRLADPVGSAVALAVLHPALRGARVVLDPAAPSVAVRAAPVAVRRAVVATVVGAAPFAAAEVGWGVNHGTVTVRCVTAAGAVFPAIAVPLAHGA